LRQAPDWVPSHLTLWRDDKLIAAAPAYIKSSSDGDFSRDWGFAESAMRAGIRYYPKLVVAAPFTPVAGRRFLVAAGEDRLACVRALVNGALELCREEKLSSLGVLFPIESEALELEALGLARRMDFQFHWRNRGYASYDEWLTRLSSKKRHQARRERAAPAAQGISIRTVRESEIRERPAAWAKDVHRFYRANIDKLMWGRPYLTEGFFVRAFQTMPDAVEVVCATRDGRLVAGAFNVAQKTRLFGRYWGCHEEHPFLHFNVCLYHSIDECIQRGVSVFEGGAGGEHKHSRGFELSPTWSAHAYLDPRLDDAIRDYLARELVVRKDALERAAEGAR
jgi:predicted N-acyltransferase